MESNIVREFEALTVYGNGGQHGDRGMKMGDLVADLTLALEESGATPAAEAPQTVGTCLRRHPRKRRLRTLRRRSDPSIKAQDSPGAKDSFSVAAPSSRHRGEGCVSLSSKEKKYGSKAASDLSESSMDELTGKNKNATPQLLRRTGDSDESYLLSLPFSSPSSSNPAPRFHVHNTANTTGTTPSVEQSVDPSDQSEDNENISLPVKSRESQNPPQRNQHFLHPNKKDSRPHSRDDLLTTDHLSTRICDSHSKNDRLTSRPENSKKASCHLKSPSTCVKVKQKTAVGGVKEADDFDVSTGTETFTPIRPHRRRRKMTKMSVEVATAPIIGSPSMDSKNSFSPSPNHFLSPDNDQLPSCLTPSKKQSTKSFSKKGKECKNWDFNEGGGIASVSGKRKRTVKDRRASENPDEEEKVKENVEKDDMEFSGDDSDIDLSTSWSSCESDLRGNLSNDEGGDEGDDELSDWPDYDEEKNHGDPRNDGDLTLNPDWDDSSAMTIEDATQIHRRGLDICKINSKTPLSSDSATTIVQGSPLESTSGIREIVPWWDNEDSNNSTIGLSASKEDPTVDTEDIALSNILNGLNNLGDLGDSSLTPCPLSSKNSYGKRSGGMAKSPGARWQAVNVNQKPVSARPHRAGRRRWSESRSSKSESNRSFSLANINAKINTFLQDQQEKELWLQPMTKKEREQISKLASLYSLHIRTENGLHQRPCPVLSKTGKTARPPDTLAIEHLLQKSQLKLVQNEVDGKYSYPAAGTFFIGGSEDPKRRRKAPPSASTPDRNFHRRRSPSGELGTGTGSFLGTVVNDAPPLNAGNFGNRLMQNLGWVPGTGLGPTGDGLREPIFATVRPKRLGLGGVRGSVGGIADGQQGAWVRATEDSEDAGIDCGSDSDLLKSEHSNSGHMKTEEDSSINRIVESSGHSSVVEKPAGGMGGVDKSR